MEVQKKGEICLELRSGKFQVNGRDEKFEAKIPWVFHPIPSTDSAFNCNSDIVNAVLLELTTWVKSHYTGVYDQLDLSTLLADFPTLAYFTLGTWMPETNYREEDDTQKKILAYSKAVFVLYIWDDRLETLRATSKGAEEVTKFCCLAGQCVFRILSSAYDSSEEFHHDFYHTQFGHTFPSFYPEAYTTFIMARDLMEAFRCEEQEMMPMAKAFDKMFQYNNWMDSPYGPCIITNGLDRLCRQHTSGFLILSSLVRLMEGVNLVEEEEDNKYVRRLEVLGSEITLMINDIFSVEREARYGDQDNFVLACCRQGKSFQESVSKAIKRLKKSAIEFQDTFDYFVSNTCNKDLWIQPTPSSALIKYAEILYVSTVGMFPAHMNMRRFQDINVKIIKM